MNNKDVIEIDNGNHVENNLSDAAFSDEEEDIGMSDVTFWFRLSGAKHFPFNNLQCRFLV